MEWKQWKPATETAEPRKRDIRCSSLFCKWKWLYGHNWWTEINHLQMAKCMILFLWRQMPQAGQHCSCVLVTSITPQGVSPEWENRSEIFLRKDLIDNKTLNWHQTQDRVQVSWQFYWATEKIIIIQFPCLVKSYCSHCILLIKLTLTQKLILCFVYHSMLIFQLYVHWQGSVVSHLKLEKGVSHICINNSITCSTQNGGNEPNTHFQN